MRGGRASARMVLRHAGGRRHTGDALGAADDQNVLMAMGGRQERRPFVAVDELRRNIYRDVSCDITN